MRTKADQVALRELLRQVGNGIDSSGNRTNSVEIPAECVAASTQELIDFCFPAEIFTNPLANSEKLCEGAILCPRADDVQIVNTFAMEQLPGESATFVSLDTPLDFGDSCGPRSVYRSDFNLESVHNETPSGLPPHELQLKVDFFNKFSLKKSQFFLERCTAHVDAQLGREPGVVQRHSVAGRFKIKHSKQNNIQNYSYSSGQT